MTQPANTISNQQPIAAGMRTFFLVWCGQLISIIGSSLTNFALGVQVYQESGSVTLYTLIILSSTLPGLLVLPLAGVLIDRWDRRNIMLLSDLGAGACSLALALLFFTGVPQLWQICLLVGLSSAFSAAQWPAFAAATVQLVPRQHLVRANGMIEAIQGIAQVCAPILATTLLNLAGLSLILALDVTSFLVSVCILLLLRFPRLASAPAATGAAPRPWWQTFGYGWHYIVARPGLLALLLLITLNNFTVGIAMALLVPFVLAVTSLDLLGAISTFSTSGLLVGSLLISIWGGPRRHIYGVLGFQTLGALSLLLAGFVPTPVVLALAGFGLFLSLPTSRSASQAIWQVKVDPTVQGRVFAIRRMIAWSTLPLAQLVAGPLADKVFTPLLLPGGALVGSGIAQLLGVGPGAGLALLFILLGLLSLLIIAGGLSYPCLRHVEAELPDAPVITSAAAQP